MESQDYDEIFKRLIDILQAQGLGWIVEQVQEVISIGKLRTEKMKNLKKISNDSGRLPTLSLIPYSLDIASTHRKEKPPSSETEVSTREDYTPQEKLRLIINAMDGVFLETFTMRKNVIRTFSHADNHIPIDGISSVSEYSSDGIKISLYDNSHIDNVKEELQILLSSLKELIYDKN